jgi:exopolysaccharide biosynthesis predicted pyruvyltransferase EpsI
VHYFPDLAFLTPPAVGSAVVDGRMFYSFRHAIPEEKNSIDYKDRLLSALQSIDQILRNRAIATASFYQVDEDASWMRDLSTGFGHGHFAQVTFDSHTEFFQKAGVVLSNRLHCLLLAARCGALPIALTSLRHSKLVSLYRTVGWSDLVLDIDDAERAVKPSRR